MVDWTVHWEILKKLQNPDLEIWSEEESDLLAEITWFRTGNCTPEEVLIGCFLQYFEAKREVFLHSLRMMAAVSFRLKISYCGFSVPEMNAKYAMLREKWKEPNFGAEEFKEDLKELYVDDEIFIESFQNTYFNLKKRKRKILARYILCRLERNLTDGEIDWKMVGRSFGCTLEHIHSNLGWDDIGNLTLLEYGINNPLGSSPYDYKREKYQGSRFQITKDLAQKYDTWGAPQIQDRKRELAEIAAQIWQIDF